MGLMVGVDVGYMAYDLTHYYLPHGRAERGVYAELRRAHMRHHYKDSTLGFGLSNSAWDVVFGTTQPLEPRSKGKAE